VENILNKAAPLGQKAGSGYWNDLDMLEVGNGGMSREEEITHFTMWAMVKSPLIMGNDLSVLTNQTKAIVGNQDVIAINQDRLGTPAVRVLNDDVVNGKGLHQFWVAPLANMTFAVAIVNFGEEVRINSLEKGRGEERVETKIDRLYYLSSSDSPTLSHPLLLTFYSTIKKQNT